VVLNCISCDSAAQGRKDNAMFVWEKATTKCADFINASQLSSLH